jgi:hypothetical protein
VIRRPLKRRCRTFFLVQTKGSALSLYADVSIDVILKLFEACEGGSAERLPLQDREPHLDLIEAHVVG